MSIAIRLGLSLTLVSQLTLAQTNITANIEHQSLQRKYVIHLPPGYDPNESLPVVITLHGGSGTSANVQGFTQMNLASNQHNFVAVYPEGRGIAPPGFSWADGRGTSADLAEIDDVGFIERLIERLAETHHIDTSKVYACGFSNGGFMTQRLACEIPHKFAAIGSLGCSMDTSLFKNCDPAQPLPMMMVSGTGDPFVPFGGGPMNGNVLPIIPVDSMVRYWTDFNNCQTPLAKRILPDLNRSDNSTVELFAYTDCDCGADIQFYKIINGGHTWPGVALPAQEGLLGETNEDIHASFELWNFFRRYSRCNGTVVGTLEADLAEPVLDLFPNPTAANLFIESNQLIAEITIHELTGRQVLRESRINLKKIELPLSTLNNGVYLIGVLTISGDYSTRKLIKH